MIRFLCVFLGFLGVALGIEIEGAYARATPPNARNAAIYMIIHNNSNDEITINFVSSNASKTAELHTHIELGGMKHMQKIESLTIGAQDSEILEPGGNHIMLLDIFEPLEAGQSIRLEMRTNNEILNLEIPIK